LKGSESNDHPYLENGKVRFKTNHAGGFLGGMSTGEDLVMRIAVKATPTVSVEQPSINMKTMKEEPLSPITRRDPTLLGRIYVVAEAMVRCAIVDALMMDRAYQGMYYEKNPWRE